MVDTVEATPDHLRGNDVRLPAYPSASSNPYGSGQSVAPAGPRPRPVDLAVKLIWVGIALSILGAIITFATLDTIVDQALEDSGASGVGADAARTGAVVGAVIGLLISVGLYAVLAIFIGKRHNWARIVYTVLVALAIVLSVFGFLGTPQPLALMVLSLVQLLLSVAVLVLLWRPESNAWFSAPR